MEENVKYPRITLWCNLCVLHNPAGIYIITVAIQNYRYISGCPANTFIVTESFRQLVDIAIIERQMIKLSTTLLFSNGCSQWGLYVEALQWRHNDRDGVWNHQRPDCLLNRLFRHRLKKTSKLRVTRLCEGNPPVTGGFPSQRASDAKNVSIWWRHHGLMANCFCLKCDGLFTIKPDNANQSNEAHSITT